MESTLRAAVDLVKDVSWFNYEPCDSDPERRISFTSRRHGNVMNEEPGQQDIKEARRLKKLVCESFSTLNASLEIVDEWVVLEINNYPKYYSAETLHKRLREMGYKVGTACGGTDEAVMLEYRGRRVSVVSGIGRPLTVCLEPSSVFMPLNGCKKIVVGLIEDVGNALDEVVA